MMNQEDALRAWKESAERNLATVAQVPLTVEQTSDFAEITTFHVAARYDDIKKELYFKASADYAKLYFSKVKEYASWLIKQY